MTERAPKGITEITGPHRSFPTPSSVTATMPKPVTTEMLLKDVLKETKETRTVVQGFGDQLVDFGQRIIKLEEAGRKHSGGIRRVSENDAAHTAELAHERSAREELAAKVDALSKETSAQTAMLQEARDAGKKLMANPYVKAIAIGLALYVLAILRKHGIEVVP